MSSGNVVAGRATPAAPETRGEILTAALDILRESGHTALTVRRVAERAGCSTIGVYTWFGGKDGLVDAILIEGFESFASALRAARPVRGPLGRLLGQGRTYRTWALTHATYYQVMFMQAVPGHVPSDAAAAAGMVAYEILRAEVHRLQQLGNLVGSDSDVVAMTVWGTVHGLVSLEIASPEPTMLPVDNSIHTRAYDLALRLLGEGLATPQRATG